MLLSTQVVLEKMTPPPHGSNRCGPFHVGSVRPKPKSSCRGMSHCHRHGKSFWGQNVTRSQRRKMEREGLRMPSPSFLARHGSKASAFNMRGIYHLFA